MGLDISRLLNTASTGSSSGVSGGYNGNYDGGSTATENPFEQLGSGSGGDEFCPSCQGPCSKGGKPGEGNDISQTLLDVLQQLKPQEQGNCGGNSSPPQDSGNSSGGSCGGASQPQGGGNIMKQIMQLIQQLVKEGGLDEEEGAEGSNSSQGSSENQGAENSGAEEPPTPEEGAGG